MARNGGLVYDGDIKNHSSVTNKTLAVLVTTLRAIHCSWVGWGR